MEKINEFRRLKQYYLNRKQEELNKAPENTKDSVAQIFDRTTKEIDTFLFILEMEQTCTKRLLDVMKHDPEGWRKTVA